MVYLCPWNSITSVRGAIIPISIALIPLCYKYQQMLIYKNASSFTNDCLVVFDAIYKPLAFGILILLMETKFYVTAFLRVENGFNFGCVYMLFLLCFLFVCFCVAIPRRFVCPLRSSGYILGAPSPGQVAATPVNGGRLADTEVCPLRAAQVVSSSLMPGRLVSRILLVDPQSVSSSLHPLCIHTCQ